MYENIASHASTSESEDTKKKIQVDKRTKAEIAFEKSKEKKVLFDFSLTVKVAPNECVIRTGHP